MRTVTLDDLREKTPELLELVQAGETLDVKDGERLVATFGPPRDEPSDETLEERIDQRTRRGLMAPGAPGGMPFDAIARPPIGSGVSAVQLFLEEERNDGR